MTVTQFTCFPLLPGAIFNDELRQTAETVVKQPGAQRMYMGVEVEDPSNIWMFCDWNSVEDHLNFSQSPKHDGIAATTGKFVNLGNGFSKHVEVQPFPPADVLDSKRSPVTEIMRAYFPSDITAEDKAVVLANLEIFREKALKTSPHFKGVSVGWGVENDFPVPGEVGKTASMVVAFAGWESIEGHIEFAQSPAFSDNAALLGGLPGLIKIVNVHVRCEATEAPTKAAT